MKLTVKRWLVSANQEGFSSGAETNYCNSIALRTETPFAYLKAVLRRLTCERALRLCFSQTFIYRHDDSQSRRAMRSFKISKRVSEKELRCPTTTFSQRYSPEQIIFVLHNRVPKRCFHCSLKMVLYVISPTY